MSAKHKIAHFIATGGYSGLSPKAPGTAGTAAALLLAFGLRSAIPWFGTLPGAALLAIATALIGLYVCDIVLSAGLTRDAVEDPQEIVIDEFAGVFITIIAAGTELWTFLLCFLLFRIFDIVKPPPIQRLEHLHGALGVMSDDLLAGVYAGIAFVAISMLW
jgi:phosphatidylglycerophosphatase A